MPDDLSAKAMMEGAFHPVEHLELVHAMVVPASRSAYPAERPDDQLELSALNPAVQNMLVGAEPSSSERPARPGTTRAAATIRQQLAIHCELRLGAVISMVSRARALGSVWPRPVSDFILRKGS